mgnify:CR=1 FL=1
MEFSNELKKSYNDAVNRGDISTEDNEKFGLASDEKKKEFITFLKSNGIIEEVKGENLDNPQELAMAISQKDGISYEEAYERVAGMPRASRASYEGNEFPILSSMGDLVTLPFRGLAGLSSAIIGEDPLQRMAKPVREDENPYTAFLGNVANEPTTYAGGLTTGGIKSLGGQAFRQSPKMISGAKEGFVAGLGEYNLQQLQQAEEGKQSSNGMQEGLVQSGVGGVLGGTLGKVADSFSKGRYNKELPTARQEARQTQKELAEIDAKAVPSGVDAKKWEEIHPMYQFGFNPKLKPNKGEIDYKNLLTIGKNSVKSRSIDPLEHTFREVGLPAYKEYGALKSSVGDDIGNIRKEYLGQIDAVSKNELLSDMNKDLMEYGGYQVKQIADMDGANPRLQVIDLDGDAIDAEDMSPNIAKTLKFLDKMPQELTGNKLELFRKQVNKNTPKDPITRQPIYDQDDMALKTIMGNVKGRIDNGIEKIAPEIADDFKSKRAEYAKLSTNHQELGRLIGKSIDSDGIETTKKGTSAMKRVVQSLQDQGSRAIWRDVKSRTGFDVERASARALQAMDEVGDSRSKSLLMEMGMMNEALKYGVDPESLLKRKGAEALEGISEFVKPTGLAGLQVEQQIKRTQQPRGMLDLIEKNPYTNFNEAFNPYLQSTTRAGLSGLGGN